ncbi:hypothetical protein [Aquimarina atlantica]|uniref:hypothetical protein n=1 Tax=Aquimarina atlantica TaxID=1317122 RepID=UPI00054F4C63|nr:hypothetical protein [Aquimarina atlantica]
MKYILRIILLISILSCSSESCKIDFERNSDLYGQALNEIYNLNLKMDSDEPHHKPVLLFTKLNNKIDTNVFDEIEFIECHEDGTVIFQAPDCDNESDFRNVIYFLAYSPKGKSHLEKKRNIGSLKKIKEDWFLGEHIETLAN